MAKSSVKHPKITPLRAFELLRALDQTHGVASNPHPPSVDRARDALASHVRAALAKVRA